MSAQKRHPFETYIASTLDKADHVGLDGLEAHEVTVIGFHWLSVKLNGKGKSKRELALPIAERGGIIGALVYLLVQLS